MAEPARNFDEPEDENARYLTARERADKQWGMDGSEEDGTPKTDTEGMAPDEIKEAEERSDDPKTDDSKESKEAEPKDQIGDGYNPKDTSGSKLSSIRNIVIGLPGRHRGWFIGGGIAAAVAALLVSAFLALLPLKIIHIVENLQGRFFATSESSISKATDKMLSGYIKKYVRPSLTKCSGSTIDKQCNTIVGNGNNPVKNLYHAWSHARLENTLANKYGFEIVYHPHKNINAGRYTLKTSGYANVEGQDISKFLNPANEDLFDEDLFQQIEPKTRNEIRNEVHSAFEKETKWKQLMYRFKVGRLLEEKYNIKRCIIACRVKDSFADWKDKKKIAAKSIIIERVLEPRAEMLGLVLQCVLGGEDCTHIQDGRGDGVNGEKQNKFQKELKAKLDIISEKYGREAVEKIIKDAEKLSEKGFTKYAVSKIIETVFANEAAGQAAADALPVLSAINTTAKVISALNRAGPTIRYMAYAGEAASMVHLYMTYRTHADEIKSGHVDAELAGSFTSTLSPNQKYDSATKTYGGSGAEGTPLYGALIDGVQPVTSESIINSVFPSAVAAATGANNVSSNYTCDNGKGVPEGKLICPEESLVHGSFLDSIEKILKTPPLNAVTAAADFYNSTAGKIIAAGSNFLGDLISRFPGIKQLSEAASDLVQPLFSKLVQIIIPSPFSDNMSGGRTFNLMAGGADVAGNDFAHHGLGGRVLNNQEVSTILNERYQEAQQIFKKSSLFAKIFDKNSSYSLVTKTAMAMPANLNSAMLSGFANILQNPFSVVMKAFGSMFSFGRVSAATDVDMCSNGGPFGVTCYGYTDKDIPSDPETYWDKNCQNSDQIDAWNQAATKSKNPHTAQLENNTTAPCLLIKSAVGSSGGYFSDSLLTSDDLGNGAASTNNVQSSSGTATNCSIPRVDMVDQILKHQADGLIQFDNPGPEISDLKDSTKTTDKLVCLVWSLLEQGHFHIIVGAINSDHHPGTLHEQGRAIDLARSDVRKPDQPEIYKWLYDNRQILQIDELIHQPLPPSTQLLDLGKDCPSQCYDQQTLNGHFSHIHVGVLP